MALSDILSALPAVNERFKEIAATVAASVKTINDSVAAEGKAVTDLASPLTAATDAIRGIVSQAAGFVQVFNPSLMELFNQTVRDASAVIGSALAPVIQSAMEVVRLFADSLVPIMEVLRPVIEQLASAVQGVAVQIINVVSALFDALKPLLSVVLSVVDVFASLLIPVINLLASAVRLLTPLIQAISTVLQVLLVPFRVAADLLGAIVEVLSAIASGLGKMFGFADSAEGFKASLEEMTKSIQSAIRSIAKVVLVAAATLSKMLGITSFIDGMIEAAGPERTDKSRGMAAPGSASIGSITDYSRAIAQAAFTASRENEKKDSQISILQEVRSQLQDIRNSNVSLLSIITEGAYAALVMAKNSAVKAVTGDVTSVVKEALESAKKAAAARGLIDEGGSDGGGGGDSW